MASIRTGHVGVRILRVALAIGNDRRLKASLAVMANLSRTNANALGLTIRPMSNRKMTRRGEFLGEHVEHARKLRALFSLVTNPTQMLDDTQHVRIRLRTNREFYAS
jgi:hypothetical protein